MGSDAAGAEARRYGKTAALLSVGVGATGLITYLYFALASHNLSAQQYGELTVLWSAVFITVSVVYRPVEQLLSRSISEHEAYGRAISGPVRIAATIQCSLALVVAGLSLALRGPIQDDLLSGNEALYWIFVGATLAYAASYFARGFFAGTRRFPLYAALMLSESIARTCFALAVALGIASGQTTIALGIVVAPLLSLMVVPYAVARRVSRHEPVTSAPAGRGPELTLAHGTGFAAAVLAIMVSEQTFLNAGPLLINASLGAAAAGFIFNVLMIARAPLQLFQAVSTSLLPHLTRLRSSDDPEDAEAFRLSVRSTILAITAIAVIVGLVMLIAGPALMQIAFGDNFTYDRAGLLIVTAGMGLYLCAATLNQAALAQGQVRRAAACWIGTAAGFVILNLLPALSHYRRVEVAFTLAAATLCALLYALYRSPQPRREDVPVPGSPQELEARLAAADEVM